MGIRCGDGLMVGPRRVDVFWSYLYLRLESAGAALVPYDTMITD